MNFPVASTIPTGYPFRPGLNHNVLQKNNPIFNLQFLNQTIPPSPGPPFLSGLGIAASLLSQNNSYKLT